MFSGLKSLMASDNILNVAWTSPLLILGGTYLSKKCGSLFAFKYFWFTIFFSWAFYSVFSPETGLSKGFLRDLFPMKLDSNAADYSYYMGADTVASSVVLGVLFYHKLYVLALPYMLFNLAYYGPSHMGGSAAALVCGLTML